MTPMDAADICSNVLHGFALACAVCFGFYVIAALVLEFIPNAPCGCFTGCGTCMEDLARVRRNRTFARRLLVGALVLAAWALLASALVGCGTEATPSGVRHMTAKAQCPPGWLRGVTMNPDNYIDGFVCVEMPPDGGAR